MEHPHRTPGLGQTQQAVGQRTAKEGLTVAACSVSKVAWLIHLLVVLVYLYTLLVDL